MYKGLRFLLDMWRPSLVVIRKPSKRWPRRMQKRIAGLLAVVRRCRIPVRRIPERAIRGAFGRGERVTQYKTALMLVQRFHFLAGVLPPPRKITESENYQMAMFAAVALAVAAGGENSLVRR